MIVHENIALHNVVEIEPACGGGVLLRRFPAAVRAALSPLGRMVSEDAAGVELRFVTPSRNFRLSVGSAPTFLAPHERHGQELVILRGAHVHSIHRLEPGRINHIHVTQLAGPDPVDTRPAPAAGRAGFSPAVWRVQFGRYPAVFHALETFGDTRRPPAPGETPARRWLAYGSSITNGASPGLHLNSYLYHAARTAGLDVLNQGLSGSCLCEPEIASFLGARDDADLVTLEIGINMRGGFTPGQFRGRAEALLDAIAAKASRRVALLTIFPNVAIPENSARQDAFDRILRELHASGRWPGLALIEGADILDETGDLSTDLIHPSDYGHARMGLRLGDRLAALLPPNRPKRRPAMNRTKVVASKNPVIPGRGVCDPHIHIFRDRAYLYASHDRAPGNTYWLMDDWQIWSSGDLVEWTLESTVRPESTYIGPCENCWATDAAERNGKFYFYFSQKNLDTGVMVSGHPGHGFADALGRPLLPRDLTPTRSYDPTVFIDDDDARTPYIVFGNHVGDGYFIARLNEDMISLAETPVNIRIDDRHARTDKSFLHKYGGNYYLSWDSNYAIAGDIRGPYRHAGNIGVSHDHGSFFAWRGQWFNAFTIFDPTVYHRATGLCYIHYRANGEMVADPLIVEHGVGHYDARWNKIEAEWYLAADGTQKVENASRGFDVRVDADGASLFFPRVHDLRRDTSVCFYAANPGPEPCRVEIRQDGVDGALLGALEIPSTFTQGVCGYDTFPCQLRNPAGTLDLHLVFHGRGGTLLALDWFKFYGGAPSA